METPILISLKKDLHSLPSLEPKVLHLLTEIENAYLKRQTTLIKYFSELNGNSQIPAPPLPWQSTFVSSLFYQKIFFAYSFLRKMLDKAYENLFYVDTQNPTLANAITKTLKYIIQKVNLKEHLAMNLYYSLLSGYGLIYIEFDPDLNSLMLSTYNPILTKITPDMNYICITRYLPTPEAVKKYNLEPSPEIYYNLSPEEEQIHHYLQNITNKAITRIDEVYGVLYLPPDDAILPAKYIILNKRHLISAELITDFEKPFVCEFLYGIDSQVSYADLIYPYHVQDTILTRTLLDTAILSLTIGIELDASNLDPDKPITQLEPFQIIYKKTPEDVVRNFSLASFNPNVLPIRQLILNEATNVSAITEFLMGLPTSKGRPTAKEVMLKTQQSLSALSTFIEKFETSFINKLLHKLLYFTLKYELQNIPHILTPEEFTTLSTLTINDLKTQIKFQITSFSSILSKQEKLEKIFSTIELLSSLNLLQLVNLPTLISELIQLLDLPPNLINTQPIPTPEK